MEKNKFEDGVIKDKLELARQNRVGWKVSFSVVSRCLFWLVGSFQQPNKVPTSVIPFS